MSKTQKVVFGALAIIGGLAFCLTSCATVIYGGN